MGKNKDYDNLRSLFTEAGLALGMSLKAQALLVQEYSDKSSNPNVSAWLRSGGVDQIGKVEVQAYNMALTHLKMLINSDRDPQISEQTRNYALNKLESLMKPMK